MTAILRALLAVALLAPVSAFAATYDLVIDRTDVPIEGQMRRVFSINGQIAGPTLRWKEGEDVTINVTNRLARTPRSTGTASCCPTTWTACRW